MKKTARFWVYAGENGGPVKLTLRPGQALSWACGGPDEEGWYFHGETWANPADHPGILRSWVDQGRDCDGFLERCGNDQATDLAAIPDYDETPGVSYPRWEELERSQRDEYAEMLMPFTETDHQDLRDLIDFAKDHLARAEQSNTPFAARAALLAARARISSAIDHCTACIAPDESQRG